MLPNKRTVEMTQLRNKMASASNNTVIDLGSITGDIENTLAGSSSDNSRIQKFKEWLLKNRSSLRPWTEFLNTKQLSRPSDATEVTKRITRNVVLYQSNYVVICLLLATYCVITSPLLLFALTMSSGACYYISARGNGQKIKMFGREFTVMEQYGLVFLISLPLFFISSAGSTVFWIIGASLFLILLHASLLATSSVADGSEAELNMEELK